MLNCSLPEHHMAATGHSEMFDREIDQRTIRGGRNRVSNPDDVIGCCNDGTSKLRATRRVTVQPPKRTADMQHDPAQETPGQWPERFVQQ